MGGPGASVLLREPLTTQQRSDLDIWLESIIKVTDEASNDKTRQFWLKKDAFPPPVSDCLFYFGVYENDGILADEEDRQQLLAQLGYIPQQSIGALVGCGSEIKHHITLAHMMLYLAEKYDGLIDMEGQITPEIEREPLPDNFIQMQRARLVERQAYIQTRLNELAATLPPGKTWREYQLEELKKHDPNSPLNRIDAEATAKFGPRLPPRQEPTLEQIHDYVHSFPGKVYEIYGINGRGEKTIQHIVDAEFLRAWMKQPNFYMCK